VSRTRLSGGAGDDAGGMFSMATIHAVTRPRNGSARRRCPSAVHDGGLGTPGWIAEPCGIGEAVPAGPPIGSLT
jgi:hypothetical protein